MHDTLARLRRDNGDAARSVPMASRTCGYDRQVSNTTPCHVYQILKMTSAAARRCQVDAFQHMSSSLWHGTKAERLASSNE